MSDARIWAVDARSARAAGWREADIWWERLQSRAKAAQLAGSRRNAALLWLAGWALGAVSQPRSDPRRVCGLANAAAALGSFGLARPATRLHGEARDRWPKTASVIASAEIRGRARSSLFHLRLSDRHGEAYARGARSRLQDLHGEAATWLSGRVEEDCGRVCRWVIERPPVYDDSRKVVAACCLLACAQSRTDREPGGRQA